jgi:hypothetical protein
MQCVNFKDRRDAVSWDKPNRPQLSLWMKCLGPTWHTHSSFCPGNLAFYFSLYPTWKILPNVCLPLNARSANRIARKVHSRTR